MHGLHSQTSGSNSGGRDLGCILQTWLWCSYESGGDGKQGKDPEVFVYTCDEGVGVAVVKRALTVIFRNEGR